MKFPSVTNRLTSSLKEKIILGELKSGERLHEINLSKEFDIGRPPLRESFRLLENSCLVKSIPRKGTFVTPISDEEFDKIYKIRELLEGFAIDEFEVINKRDFPGMEEVVKLVEVPSVSDLEDHKKLLELWRYTSDFHFKMIAETDNKYLQLFYSIITDNLARYQIIYLKIVGAAHDSIVAHGEILSHLQNGNYDKAKKILLEHLELTYKRVRKKILNHITM